MAHANFETDGGFNAEKMAMLKAVVKRRSATMLNNAEVEDVVMSIISDATITASKPGSTQDVATIAFAYARHTNYYSRAKVQAVDLRMAIAVAARDDYAETPASDDVEERMSVRSVLRSLPKDLARVLWLCDAEGFTLAEAAMMLGVPVATVHRRRIAARVAFKGAWAA